MFIAFLAAVLVQSTPAPAAPQVAWAQPPRVETPPKALEAGASGSVVLRCDFMENGAATNCVVISETPEGLGFGREAIRGVRTARAQPGQTGPREVRLNFSTR
ncbi:TonB family protein [Brevundimonas sp. WCHBH090558]|uniref:TonB family protein n=1 Tax=Brevundimonas huaxiensis TaxID=2725493 RepID=UPI00162A6538|nr:TonB family protein [Brevundimonas huaxiensis]MBC1182131.1 TonB family protein [Brevundimonas huaxiensis]